LGTVDFHMFVLSNSDCCDIGSFLPPEKYLSVVRTPGNPQRSKDLVKQRKNS